MIIVHAAESICTALKTYTIGKDEGVVLKTMESMEQFESDPYFKELYGNETQEQKEEVFVDLDKNNCVMERPKMLYNEKTDKYVIWFHADGRYPGVTPIWKS